MPFQIIRNDITKVYADAIVNTANPEVTVGAGVDSAIYQAAGWDQMLAERQKIGRIAPGECAATKAYDLPARYVIHTVGPAWRGGRHGEFDLLASCYRKSMRLAELLDCHSIAFPLISTGTYGFPKDKALEIALHEIQTFLEGSEMDITLVVFDRKAYELSSDLVANVDAFIDEKYVEKRDEEKRLYAQSRHEGARQNRAERRKESGRLSFWPRHRAEKRAEKDYADADEFAAPELCAAEPSKEAAEPSYSNAPQSPAVSAAPAPGAAPSQAAAKKKKRTLDDVITHISDNFQQRLLRLIDEKQFTDPEIYKKANIDRKLFSKIRCNPSYQPKKQTALALAMALELNLDETVDLIGRAGYALSPGSAFDVIIEYCIENQIYNLFTVNSLLFKYEQPLLGQ